MLVDALVPALEAAGVPYCVVGGVAINLHGIPRMTYDVDIVVEPTSSALERCAAVLSSLGLVARVPVRLADLADPELRQSLLEEKNLVAVPFLDPGDPLRAVDVLVSPPVDPRELVARAVIMNRSQHAVRVACLADLIAMKRLAGRAQDLDDAELLSAWLDR